MRGVIIAVVLLSLALFGLYATPITVTDATLKYPNGTTKAIEFPLREKGSAGPYLLTGTIVHHAWSQHHARIVQADCAQVSIDVDCQNLQQCAPRLSLV